MKTVSTLKQFNPIHPPAANKGDLVMLIDRPHTIILCTGFGDETIFSGVVVGFRDSASAQHVIGDEATCWTKSKFATLSQNYAVELRTIED